MEVTNRFKGLDLTESLKNYGRNVVQDAVIKTIPKEKECKKAKWLSEEDLQAKLRKEERRKAKVKRKDIPM